MELVFIILYAFFLTFILFYSFVQFNLVLLYSKRKGENKEEELIDINDKEALPFVTIQLPIYNELYVIERLIDAVAEFDYPRNKFEVQVLDDSTDETVEVTAKKVTEMQSQGLDIKHVRRDDRKGFKAGALAYGMELARGEFIAIFDADFIPVPQFLNKTIPYFKNSKVGVVQTRWEHINQDYSLLTRLQAFGLDAHFSVEQGGRNRGGHFINFNGTAGVWRKVCIEDSGGWQSDTITEDLDLSYRAQLRNWEFKYLENVGSPAELPAAMNALKTQQFRWTKGAAECTIKNLPRVFKTKGVPFGTRIHAIFHLMNSFIFVCILMTALMSIPLLFIKKNFPEHDMLFKWASIYALSMVLLGVFYWVSLPKRNKSTIQSIGEFFRLFPLFLTVSMGLSLHNSIAVFEGYAGKKTAFIRTPKFNINKSSDSWKGNKYLVNNISLLTILEGVMVLYFLGGIAVGVYLHDYGMIPFHVMLTIGFAYTFVYTMKHSKLV